MSLCTGTAKANEFFAPYQFGIAYPSGAEKMIHGLRSCVEERWTDEDFTVLKIYMRNACFPSGSGE